ncbi:MAG: HdeD family acid-resistance protein [Syntrophobacteraceae bacterium]|jgi:uncharacterized membrane protein HdeD (DUF308 family)
MEGTRDVRHVDSELMHYRLGWLVTIGFVMFTLGMTALYAPYYSSFSLQNLIGSFFLISGGMFVADAFSSRHEGRFVPEFLLGLLYLIFVYPIAVYAASEARILTLFLAIFFALEGILKIFFAMRSRRESNWTWGLTSGIVSVVIGAAVWGVPAGTPLVGVMVGIDLSYSGLATIMIAHGMRKTLEMREILCIGDVCFSE